MALANREGKPMAARFHLTVAVMLVALAAPASSGAAQDSLPGDRVGPSSTVPGMIPCPKQRPDDAVFRLCSPVKPDPRPTTPQPVKPTPLADQVRDPVSAIIGRHAYGPAIPLVAELPPECHEPLLLIL